MPYFDGHSGRVYYRHWACDQPRAGLIFLHGFGEHSGLYHRYGAALNARGIDLWALDEVGHGLSDGDRGRFGSLDGLAANGSKLTAIAQASVPGLPLLVAGHSLGSVAAVLLALDSPQHFGGVVISGAPLSPAPWLSDSSASEGPIDLDPADLSSDPFYLDELANDPLAFTSLEAADGISMLGQAFGPAWERFERDLPGLALPVLAVHGEGDQVAPIEGVLQWRERVAGLQVVPIIDAGHDVLNERAHQHVATTIADFILAASASTTSTTSTSAPVPS